MRTEFPGVFRRGAKFVVVYRVDGRQRKQAVSTFSAACAVKLARDAEARDLRRGPTLHAYVLTWLDRYAGSGHDSVRENTAVSTASCWSTSRLHTSIARFASAPEELAGLLDEAPPKWRPLRWSDLHLDGPAPRLQVSRAIVTGVVGAPKSRHGKRLVPLPVELAATLAALRPVGVPDDAFVFPGREGGP